MQNQKENTESQISYSKTEEENQVSILNMSKNIDGQTESFLFNIAE